MTRGRCPKQISEREEYRNVLVQQLIRNEQYERIQVLYLLENHYQEEELRNTFYTWSVFDFVYGWRI